jgi:pimeloyl-ACP methyl ester carboxylesterase
MLEQVHCQVLLLNGRFDQLRVGARAYLRACPSAREEVIARAGHLSNLDQPEAFADALLRFTRTVLDSAPGS